MKNIKSYVNPGYKSIPEESEKPIHDPNPKTGKIRKEDQFEDVKEFVDFEREKHDKERVKEEAKGTFNKGAHETLRKSEPFYRNYDYTEKDEKMGPGSGLYHGKMDKFKSVKEFIDYDRKRRSKKRKAALATIIDQYKL